jgi:hypothetical protein
MTCLRVNGLTRLGAAAAEYATAARWSTSYICLAADTFLARFPEPITSANYVCKAE